jgi:hypothetical protein
MRKGNLKVQVSPAAPFAEAISLANISWIMSCCSPVVEPLIRIVSPTLISFSSIRNYAILGFGKKRVPFPMYCFLILMGFGVVIQKRCDFLHYS